MCEYISKYKLFAATLFFFLAGFVSYSQTPAAELNEENLKVEEENGKEDVNVSGVIIEHVLDNHVWHFSEGFVLPLPVMVYSSEKGLDIFSSGHFFDEHHRQVPYKEYKLENGKVQLAEGDGHVFDFSITKNVAMLFINSALLLLVFVTVAKRYRKNKNKAPKGLQSFLEPAIVFVRDEIVKPNVGPHYEKYLPYLLTLFFFILFGNLLGLFPGAGNLTGNIAVTGTLAVLTFLITNFSGNKEYWLHVFWTPGVPFLLRPIIILVEVIGLFTKPFALMIRLFVAITAGHIVLLSLICLTFIFGSIWVGFGSTVIVLFISVIELLVAAIQAYVFTLFSSLYIGMAIAENEHH